MSNPLAVKKTAAAVDIPTEVIEVKFTEYGRTGKSQSSTIRAVRVAAGNTLDEDPHHRGIWIDGKVLVPWANIVWAEYA